MKVFENLDRLADAVRTTLPDKKALSHLEANQKTGCVTLTWHNTKLAVKLSGESYEVKDDNLFVTGTSMLLGRVLTTKQKIDTVLGAVIESLRQAETLAPTDSEKAIALLESIKPAIRHLGHADPKPT